MIVLGSTEIMSILLIRTIQNILIKSLLYITYFFYNGRCCGCCGGRGHCNNNNIFSHGQYQPTRWIILFLLLQDSRHILYYLFLFGNIFLHSHHHQRCKVRPNKECKSGVNKGMQRLYNLSQRYISSYMLRQFRHRYQLHWLSYW